MKKVTRLGLLKVYFTKVKRNVKEEALRVINKKTSLESKVIELETLGGLYFEDISFLGDLLRSEDINDIIDEYNLEKYL